MAMYKLTVSSGANRNLDAVTFEANDAWHARALVPEMQKALHYDDGAVYNHTVMYTLDAINLVPPKLELVATYSVHTRKVPAEYNGCASSFRQHDWLVVAMESVCTAANHLGYNFVGRAIKYGANGVCTHTVSNTPVEHEKGVDDCATLDVLKAITEEWHKAAHK